VIEQLRQAKASEMDRDGEGGGGERRDGGEMSGEGDGNFFDVGEIWTGRGVGGGLRRETGRKGHVNVVRHDELRVEMKGEGRGQEVGSETEDVSRITYTLVCAAVKEGWKCE
jgi:hypothetical protein